MKVESGGFDRRACPKCLGFSDRLRHRNPGRSTLSCLSPLYQLDFEPQPSSPPRSDIRKIGTIKKRRPLTARCPFCLKASLRSSRLSIYSHCPRSGTGALKSTIWPKRGNWNISNTTQRMKRRSQTSVLRSSRCRVFLLLGESNPSLTKQRDFGTSCSPIPPHGRWRHIDAGLPRVEPLIGRWRSSPNPPSDKEITKRLIDLFLVSVLLDAGAGNVWSYTEPSSGQNFARSEGLGVASLHMFIEGLFSGDPAQPYRVDG